MKMWYCWAMRWYLGDVVVGNVTFHMFFLQFWMCYSFRLGLICKVFHCLSLRTLCKLRLKACVWSNIDKIFTVHWYLRSYRWCQSRDEVSGPVGQESTATFGEQNWRTNNTCKYHVSLLAGKSYWLTWLIHLFHTMCDLIIHNSLANGSRSV